MTRRRRRSWMGLVGIVLLGAAVQGVTALPGTGTTESAAFIAAVAVSALALFAQIAVTSAATTAIVGLPVAWRSVLAWTGVILVAGILVGILVPLALPLVAVAAACVLPAAARGRRGALRGVDVFRRAPVAATLAAVVTVLASVLTWVFAVASGLFLAGAAGGVASWLWAGAVGALLLLWWTKLQDRPEPPSGRETRAQDRGEVRR
ncbi:hypothetical protein [Microbacterium sp. SLBN-146]|uniref:hypothetical protein n=1 Tax=Microbacterium sp. SLBN-146 TaxID=2768457 RepID=UPI00114E8E70|nr:hypothetical protein [Microbacterium sp. SLBN-146]